MKGGDKMKTNEIWMIVVVSLVVAVISSIATIGLSKGIMTGNTMSEQQGILTLSGAYPIVNLKPTSGTSSQVLAAGSNLGVKFGETGVFDIQKYSSSGTTTLLRVQGATGNVGIGTGVNNPKERLDVYNGSVIIRESNYFKDGVLILGESNYRSGNYKPSVIMGEGGIANITFNENPGVGKPTEIVLHTMGIGSDFARGPIIIDGILKINTLAPATGITSGDYICVDSSGVLFKKSTPCK